MAFETNKFTVVRKKRLEKSTFGVECNIESNAEIEKVLSVCHSASVDTAEVLNGCINFVGNIDVCLLFLTVDGEIGTINSSCPFSGKFEDDAIAVGDKVGISVEVDDYSIESVTAQNVKIGCTCSASGVLILCREVGSISCADEDVCIKQDEISVCTLVGQAKESFVVESGFSIKEPVRKVICSDSQVAVKSVESGVNFVSVGGEVITRLLYLTENDRFETAYTTENFKEEVELEGVTREAVGEAVACVRKNAVKCEIEDAERGIEVKISVPVEVKVTSYLERTESVAADLYSTKNELQVSTESFEMTKQLPCELFEEKFDGSLTLDEDKPRVDKIMFVGGSNLALTNFFVKDGELTVEGVAKTNVIYLNDETNSLHSVVVEVPFVVSDKVDTADGTQVSVNAVLSDVDVVAKKGHEFLFDAKLKIFACFDCLQVGAVISGAEVANEVPERDYGMELVFANAGMTAWDIAKAIRVKEETVLLQNPEVAFPLAADENIVVFFQKQ